MLDNKLGDILDFFIAAAEKDQKTTELLSWLEQKIYQIGRNLYNNNLPNSISDLKSESLLTISIDKDYTNELNTSQSTSLYIHYPHNSLNSDEKLFIFSIFLATIINNMGNHHLFIFLLSNSPLLSKGEINCNFYNFNSYQQLVNYIDLSAFTMENETVDLTVVNFDKDYNHIWNNITFINPISEKLTDFVPAKIGLLDLCFSKSLNSNLRLAFTNYITEQLLKTQ